MFARAGRRAIMDIENIADIQNLSAMSLVNIYSDIIFVYMSYFLYLCLE